MLRGYRSIIFAFGLILAGAGEPPKQERQQETKQASHSSIPTESPGLEGFPLNIKNHAGKSSAIEAPIFVPNGLPLMRLAIRLNGRASAFGFPSLALSGC